MEVSVVLVVFAFILIFGYSFYVQSQQMSINQQVNEIKSLRTIGMSQVVSLPELRCTDYSLPNCLDYYKILAFNELMNKDKTAQLFYTSKFGTALITVDEIYPHRGSLVVFNATPKDYQSAYSSQLAVNIYNVSSDSYNFGILTIKIYN